MSALCARAAMASRSSAASAGQPFAARSALVSSNALASASSTSVLVLVGAAGAGGGAGTWACFGGSAVVVVVVVVVAGGASDVVAADEDGVVSGAVVAVVGAAFGCGVVRTVAVALAATRAIPSGCSHPARANPARTTATGSTL